MRKLLQLIFGPMYLSEKNREIAQRDTEIKLLKDACFELNESLKFEIARRGIQPIPTNDDTFLAGYRKGLFHQSKLEFVPKTPEPIIAVPKKKKRRK